MKHTKEPWVAEKTLQGRDSSISNKHGKTIAIAYKNENIDGDDLANAKRIALCVNACEGITDAVIEEGIIEEALIAYLGSYDKKYHMEWHEGMGGRMKLLKVLNKDLTSPYQGFEFELGKKYVCDDFDTSDNECSKGFYAVDFNGIVYALNRSGRKHSVFEVEVGGRSKEFNQFKRRYEEITILRELAEDEIKEGLLACEEKEGYRVCEACYPVHPFEVNPMPLEDAKKLLEEWKKLGVRTGIQSEFGRGFGLGFGQGFGHGFGLGFGRGFGRGFGLGFGRGFGRGFGQGFGLGFGQGFGQVFSLGFGLGFG